MPKADITETKRLVPLIGGIVSVLAFGGWLFTSDKIFSSTEPSNLPPETQNMPPEIQIVSHITVEGGRVSGINFFLKDKEQQAETLQVSLVDVDANYLHGVSVSRKKEHGVISFIPITTERQTNFHVEVTDKNKGISRRKVTVKIQKPIVRNCLEALEMGWSKSGYFQLEQFDHQVSEYYCDMKLHGGGWTKVTDIAFEAEKNFLVRFDDIKLPYKEVLLKSDAQQFVDYDYYGAGNKEIAFGLDRTIMLFGDGNNVAGFNFPSEKIRPCAKETVSLLKTFLKSQFIGYRTDKALCRQNNSNCFEELIIEVPTAYPKIVGVTDNNTVQKNCLETSYYKINLELYVR